MKTSARITALAGALALALAPPVLAEGEPPVVSGLGVSAAHQLTFSVSEYSMVHVLIRHRGDRVARVERAFFPGAGRISLTRVGGTALAPGTYSATVTASDVRHNWSPAEVVRFRIG